MRAVATFLALLLVPTASFGQGKAIVRVEDPSGSHCIDAEKEDVTIHLRRIFIEKVKDFFTEDSRAGVLVTAKLTGRTKGPSVSVQTPSVTLVSIKDEKAGRISLPLEYEIASELSLKQDEIVTTNISLAISLAKREGETSFGKIVDVAGKALSKLPIPNNPYVDATNKFLNFANDAIGAATANGEEFPIAEIALSFQRGREMDLEKCRGAGHERTGVVAVLLSSGEKGGKLIPTVDTDRQYCFKYSSTNTYELLAAQRVGGSCPSDAGAYSGVLNDYIMFFISANPNANGFSIQSQKQEALAESRRRCNSAKLEPQACGLSQ